ncbi:MAG: hypothetical protein OHK0037_07760 [Elainellaceae cyanobacterium]
MRPQTCTLPQSSSWSGPPQATVTAIALMAALGLLTALPSTAQAQAILEDGTLGAESSVVTRDVLIRGILSDRIDGGARRGANLFHSFEQFNIDAGRGAYFANPAGVEAIFSRVTGGDPSNILGRLGVLGSADLYFLNPNGVLFGPAASLDLQGAFLATTASGFQFGDLGRFSATAPEVPSALLTINPSALFFNQVAAGSIVNRSVTPVAPGSTFLVGLRVPNGQSLTLLGGDVQVEGGRLSAFGGRIDIGAVATSGTVLLNPNGSLVIPDGLVRGDVTFTNGAILDVLLGDKGDISVTARNISVLGDSELQAGIASTFGAAGSQAGDLRLNATGTVRIAEGSLVRNRVNENAIGNAGNVEIVANQLVVLDGAQISTSTLGRGNAGNVILTVGDRIVMDESSSTFSVVEPTGVGNGGNIEIETGSLTLSRGSQLIASTRGRGDAGSVFITARDFISVDGTPGVTNQLSSSIFSQVNEGAVGAGGNIDITTGSLFLTNGAQLTASTLGEGSAGSVTIRAGDRILLDGGNTAIFSRVEPETLNLRNDIRLQGGDIFIETGTLTLANGGQLLANTAGRGSAGSVIIRARGDVTFRGRSADGVLPSAAFSRVNARAIGDGGNIDIQARNLSVLNGARLFAGTLGQGNSGDIIVNVTGRVRFAGTGSNGSNGQTSVAFANAEGDAVGNGGNIRITANVLELADGAQFVASTRARGNAGSVIINAGDRVSLDGSDTAIFSRVGQETLAFSNSPLFKGGNIEINTGSLFLTNGAELQAGTEGRGNAGEVIINARDRISLDGSNIFTDVGEETLALDDSIRLRGGNIRINTGSLFMTNTAQLQADTDGQGDAGSVMINARDRVSLDGGGTSIFTNVGKDTLVLDDTIQLRAGDIRITSGTLTVTNGAQLQSDTTGQGDAGSVIVRATGDVTFQGRSANGSLPSSAFSRVGAGGQGRGGNIDIRSRNLSVLHGAQLFSGTLGKGDSGDIVINATGRVRFAGTGPNGRVSVAFSNVEGNAVGDGGDIRIYANRLELADGAQFVASTGAQGNAGDVVIRVGDRISLDGDGTAIFSSVGADTLALADDVRLRGGAIDIETGSLFLTNGASLVASTAGRGNAGRVTIRASDRVSLRGTETSIFSNVQSGAIGRGGTVRIQTGSLSIRQGGQLVANTDGQGNAGNIRIIATGNVRLTGFTNETGRSSGLFTNTRPGAQGRGGEIFIQADRLQLRNGAAVYAVSENNRRGGSIRLSVNEFEATGGGQVIASALRQGRAGSITLNGGAILLSGSDPTVGDRREKFGSAVANAGDGQSGFFADTQPNSRGRGGSITVRGGSLQLGDRATISAQTAGRGDAGDINIAIRGRTQLSNANITAAGRLAAGGSITLRTGNLNLDDNAAITAANTGGRTAGNITLNVGDRTSLSDSNITAASRRDAGGNITLNTGDLFLTQRAAITAASNGRGTAGNIRINVGDRLHMSDSDITTRAPRSSGGNIEINTGELASNSVTLLEGDSDITTDSKLDGGNITIGGAGVVAFDDSDIVSRAAEGRGGNITLSPFFSETNPPGNADNFDNNDQVDLNASGQAAPGQITTPDTSSIQNSLTPLTDASVNENQLLANSCVVRDRQSGRFVITGSGGLPYAPGNASLSPFPTGDVQPLPETAPEPAPQNRSWQPGDPIIEPQGLYELADGRLVLSRECNLEENR